MVNIRHLPSSTRDISRCCDHNFHEIFEEWSQAAKYPASKTFHHHHCQHLHLLQRPKWTTSILSDVKLHLNKTFEESLICDLWHQSEDRTKMKTLVIYDTLGLAAEVVHQPNVAQYFAISHAVNALWLTPSMLVMPPVFTPSTLMSSTSNTGSNITLHCTLRKYTVHPRQLGQSYKNNKVSDCIVFSLPQLW